MLGILVIFVVFLRLFFRFFDEQFEFVSGEAFVSENQPHVVAKSGLLRCDVVI